jgi:hypothetical protein
MFLISVEHSLSITSASSARSDSSSAMPHSRCVRRVSGWEGPSTAVRRESVRVSTSRPWGTSPRARYRWPASCRTYVLEISFTYNVW